MYQKTYDEILKDVILKGHEIITYMIVQKETEEANQGTVWIKEITDSPCDVLDSISRFVYAVIEADKTTPIYSTVNMKPKNVSSQDSEEAPDSSDTDNEAIGKYKIKIDTEELDEFINKAEVASNLLNKFQKLTSLLEDNLISAKKVALEEGVEIKNGIAIDRNSVVGIHVLTYISIIEVPDNEVEYFPPFTSEKNEITN